MSRQQYIVFGALLLSATVLALALRLPRLEQRPMHTDEAVHGVKAGILLDTGEYIYDPYEYHGPIHYYCALPFIWLSGARSSNEIPGEFPLRIGPVVFGVLLVIMLLLVRDGMGRGPTLCAALLTALSPAMVFYSRYYIQEIYLVVFSFGAIACGWRYSRSRRLVWALLTGASVGLMHGTKETALIAVASMIGGVALTLAYARLVEKRQVDVLRCARGRHVLAGSVCAALVAGLILSVFLSNPRAILDGVLTYGVYLSRGATGASSTHGAAIHNHPWHFYLAMLAYYRNAPGPWWSEGFILVLSLVGFVWAFWRKKAGECRDFPRFIAVYTLLMILVYSAIPYKTPWCMLGFLHGLILLAGCGASALVGLFSSKVWKVGIVLVLVAGAFQLGTQAYRASFVFYADPRNPYVYGHTGRDVYRLVQRMEDLTALDPSLQAQVIAGGNDYWPLPWYLRGHEGIGYWNAMPEQVSAPVIITTPEFEEAVDDMLVREYQKEFYGLRSEVLMVVYVEKGLWDRFIATRMQIGSS